MSPFAFDPQGNGNFNMLFAFIPHPTQTLCEP